MQDRARSIDPLPMVSMAAFRRGDADAAEHFLGLMRRHSFCILGGDDDSVNSILSKLVTGSAAFFKRPDRAKYVGKVAKSKAHSYPLWGTGYTHSFVGGKSKRGREQYHVVVGAADDETPWPPDKVDAGDGDGSYAGIGGSLHASCAAAIAMLEEVTIRGLCCLLPEDCKVEESLKMAWKEHGDSSVLDLFNYTSADGDYGMSDHTDPGLLTILPASCTPALEVFDVESEQWVQAERLCGTPSLDASSRDAIIFSGHMLEELTNGKIRACRHMVTKPDGARISAIYELRADASFVSHVKTDVKGVATATPSAAAAAADASVGRGESAGNDGGSDDANRLVVLEKDREMTEGEVQYQMRRLGISY